MRSIGTTAAANEETEISDLKMTITIITLGLFLLVINVIIVKLADYLMSSFDVHGFLNALLFSLALSVVNAVVDMVID